MIDLGQLIFTGVNGLTLSEEEEIFIESNNIGGVILFSRNYESPAQLMELVNSIQELRQEHPLFIGVDQEGGRVTRFKDKFTQFPAMLEIVVKKSPKLIFDVHTVIANELKVCGINVNFSPCCDVLTNPHNNVIGDRSFGKTTEDVQKYTSAAIRGLQTAGILACAKHFPGHGSTSIDSHKELPTVKRTLEELEDVDIHPFNKAVKSKVEFIMMGHLIVEAIDKTFPASLSKKNHQYVREKLRYKRIIISDDMQMGAITKHFGEDEAPVLALDAGSDILCYRDIDKAKIALSAIRKAVKANRLEYKNLNEKVDRVKDCKQRHLSKYLPAKMEEIEKTFSDEGHNKILEAVLC